MAGVQAAGEMRERLEKLLGPETAQGLRAGTFHSFCHLLLRRELHMMPSVAWDRCACAGCTLLRCGVVWCCTAKMLHGTVPLRTCSVAGPVRFTCCPQGLLPV